MVKKAKPRAKRRAKKAEKGIKPADCVLPEGEAAEARKAVADAGGFLVGGYRDPWGGKPVLVAVVPPASVEPTPFQRDLSPAHEKRLSVAIEKLGRFLDPLIVVPHEGKFWTPNGRHRLEAMRRLGARAVTVLVVPEPEAQYQILALNIEKAHSLREKSLEVVRMYRSLAGISKAIEADHAFEFEEPAFATLGVCYEANGRFSGGAYHPILKRVDEWLEDPLPKALKEREKRAAKVQKLDEHVARHVEALKAKGFKSPYLKAFVVARVNPLRFMKTVPAFDDALDDIIARAARFDAGRIRQEDIAASGGPAE